MVQFTIPPKSRFLSPSTIFTAVYNAVTPGRYDFGNTPACQNVLSFPLDTGCVYLIDTISIGGNISEGEFLGSISTFPTLTFRFLRRNEAVYQYPLPIVNYADGRQIPVYVKSDIAGDQILLSMAGSFVQLPSMIGLTSIIVCVSLSVYRVDNRDYVIAYDGITCPGKSGSNLRG